MGIHDNDVIGILGQEAWDLILHEVTRGSIGKQKMADIALQLGDEVSGNHLRRGDHDEAEMREILTDCYRVKLFSFNPQQAIQVFIDVFGHATVKLRPLQQKLMELVPVSPRTAAATSM
jgi:hypothetical protein